MISRYTPQLNMLEIGVKGQENLACARLLIVGCGALGSPIAMYLAGAGIGNITIADFDTIEITNLHRQVFYTEDEAGLFKSERLKKQMERLNSQINVTSIGKLITPNDLKPEFDMIADAADNPATTYMINDFCLNYGIPFSTAGVSGWQAQIFTYIPGSYSYEDIFPKPSDNAGILPCSIEGVTGPTAALAASLQASEIIKVIIGKGGTKSRLITANLLTNEFKTFC